MRFAVRTNYKERKPDEIHLALSSMLRTEEFGVTICKAGTRMTRGYAHRELPTPCVRTRGRRVGTDYCVCRSFFVMLLSVCLEVDR